MKQNDGSRSLSFLHLALAASALVFALGRPALAGSAPAKRATLAQSGCEICLAGTPTVQWSGTSGSIHVDRIDNHGERVLGDLGLFVALASEYPDFRVPWDPREGRPEPSYFQVSHPVWLPPLSPGGSHANLDSGSIRFDASGVPAGEHWMLLMLVMDVPYAWEYQDYVVMKDKVTCDGSSCAVRRPCSNAGVAGAWGYTKIGTLFAPTGATPFATMGILSLERDGTLTGVNTGSVGGHVSSDVLKGTFEIEPDCTGTATVEVHDPSGALLRTIGMALVVDENATHLRGLVTSLTLPNGTLLPTAITADATLVSPKAGTGR